MKLRKYFSLLKNSPNGTLREKLASTLRNLNSGCYTSISVRLKLTNKNSNNSHVHTVSQTLVDHNKQKTD